MPWQFETSHDGESRRNPHFAMSATNYERDSDSVSHQANGFVNGYGETARYDLPLLNVDIAFRCACRYFIKFISIIVIKINLLIWYVLYRGDFIYLFLWYVLYHGEFILYIFGSFYIMRYFLV